MGLCYLNGLNEEQLQAATHSEGYLRVIAGAGSGKTRMLVARYAYLVDAMGIDPASILCVTFTNKAAAEMRSRIRSLIGDGHDTSLVSTYHGFCVRMLREDADKIFYPTSFQIIDTVAQKDILKDIYDELELKLDFAAFEKVIKEISGYKADGAYVRQMISRDAAPGPDEPGLTAEIVRRYLARQKRLFLMDFEDLIQFGLHLLRARREVREKWQRRLNYVQVDEFQDSSAREMELVDILSGGYGNLMVVGDPDQNIYEWRGSDVSLLVDFDKTHSPTKTAMLALNYRSTDAILACANELIGHNRLRIEKELRPAEPGRPCKKPIHYHARTEESEAAWIAQTIREGAGGGRPYSDYAVLYRAGHLSRMIENALLEAGVPYEIKGGVAFYRRMEILDAIAFLKLVARKDDLSFKRVVNKPPRRMGRVRIARLQEMAKPGEALVDVLARCIDDTAFRGSGAGEFLDILVKLHEAASEQPLPTFIGTVLAETGYERYIRELGDMERFDNLVEFKQTAAEFVSRYGEEVTLDTYLDHLALQTDDELRDGGDKVKLMTIHASKGLEFPAVFMVGLSEGTFPSSRTVEERKALGLEEERRLCYVAITRAREKLYLTDSEGRTSQGQSKLPSRFLFEIGEDNYTRMGAIPKSLRDAAARYVSSHSPSIPAEKDSPPERVTHPVFGDGIVRKVDEKRLTCEVWFGEIGQTRTLSMSFAKAHPRKLEKKPIAGQTEPRRGTEGKDSENNLAKTGRETLIESAFRRSDVSSSTPAKTTSCQDVAENQIGYAKRNRKSASSNCDAASQKKGRAPLPPKYRYKELTDDPSETNLWKRSDVPHEDWTCVGITDLGKGNRAICGMCGEQEIRYVHHMEHPDYPKTIDAGRVCAGWMEGDPDAALQRERDVKNWQRRRGMFLDRKWKKSRKGNDYIKVDGRNAVVFEIAPGKWKYAIGNESSPFLYGSKDEAALAAFDMITHKSELS